MRDALRQKMQKPARKTPPMIAFFLAQISLPISIDRQHSFGDK
jgi:hypothetical protein